MSFVPAGRGGFFFWRGGGGFCWQRWWGWVGLGWVVFGLVVVTVGCVGNLLGCEFYV